MRNRADTIQAESNEHGGVPQRVLRLPAILLVLALAAAACSDSSDAAGGESSRDAESGLVDDEGEEAGGDDEDAADEAMSGGSDASPGTGMDDSGRVFGEQEPEGTTPSTGGFFATPDDAGGTFAGLGFRDFIATNRDPVSTFALDVDTASYTLGAQWLESGSLPPQDSVRVEEYVNAFRYDYPVPLEGLVADTEAGPSPFNPDNVILRIGVQAEEVTDRERPDANLTFVVDTSGSMDRADRLGLVKEALTGLVSELDRRDSVAIVTYSDGADVLLAPTMVSDRDVILDAIDSLRPTGSTNLEAGLRQGYALASEAFLDGGINRVILASDGVANVGMTDPDGLVSLIRDDADSGTRLVTIGVGMGTFNDVVMEKLADDGDGFYAYVNDIDEAHRLFSEELVGTLLTVAIDTKIQVEFDADSVAAYRLIGFENRAVRDSDFRNDRVDAGEIGAGHQVTAVYELELQPGVRERDDLGVVRLRWEEPGSGSVEEKRFDVSAAGVTDDWDETSDDFRLAVTVAALAEILRGNPHAGEVSVSQVVTEAEALAGLSDATARLLELAEAAERLG